MKGVSAFAVSVLMATASVAATGPIVINVVIDGFGPSAESQEEARELVAENIESIRAMAPFNALSKGALDFNKVSTVTTDNVSALGIRATNEISKCYFVLPCDFATRLAEETKTRPKADFTIILVKTDKNAGGCAYKTGVMIISDKIDRFGVAHELGHTLGGLDDEYGAETGLRFPALRGEVQSRNCTADKDKPGWEVRENGVPVKPLPACRLYDHDIFHPTKSCRMNSDRAAELCCVCLEWMIRSLEAKTGETILRSKTDCDVPPVKAQEPGSKSGAVVIAERDCLGKWNILGKRQRGLSYVASPPFVRGSTFAALISGTTTVAAESWEGAITEAHAYLPHGLPFLPHINVTLFTPAAVTFFVPDNVDLLDLRNFSVVDVTLPASVLRRKLVIDGPLLQEIDTFRLHTVTLPP